MQFLCAFAYGVMLNLIPDLSKHLGISNKGLFFGVFTFSSLIIRLIFAKSSDVYGREIVLKVSSLMMFFSLLLVGYAQTPFVFFLSAVVYGFSYGMNTPTLHG